MGFLRGIARGIAWQNLGRRYTHGILQINTMYYYITRPLRTYLNDSGIAERTTVPVITKVWEQKTTQTDANKSRTKGTQLFKVFRMSFQKPPKRCIQKW